MIEESANRKEQLIWHKGGSVDDENKVNDMLINAIEAKLALLNEA